MTSTCPPPVSPEEYLLRERTAEYKSEYVGGEIRAMTGATREHVLIAANLVRELGVQLRGRPCETYGTDIRVKVPGPGTTSTLTSRSCAAARSWRTSTSTRCSTPR